MPTPAAGSALASQQQGHAAFDGGFLLLSGTVGSDCLNTQHQCFVCVFEIVSPTLRTQKDLRAETAAFFCAGTARH